MTYLTPTVVRSRDPEPLLFLNSNGGDIDAAMRVGEFIRQKKFHTGVISSCASACVLVFLGGVERWVFDGKIGLHRPYSVNYSITESEAKQAYEDINHRIREYLNRMNIPEGLLNIMNTVPPTEIMWLTDKNNSNQLEALFIVGTDPVWQDQRDSLEAKQNGISKQELYSRRNRVKAICGDIIDIIKKPGGKKCEEDVLNGRR